MSKKSKRPITRNSLLYKTIIRAIEAKKGSDIRSLDLKKIKDSFTDFIIICSVDNPIQAKAIADEINDQVWQNLTEKPFNIEGKNSEKWIILDYVDVVVHIMHQSHREYYRLEEFWSAATLKEIRIDQ